MNSATRERLAKTQGDLVRALVGKGPVPAGFDEARVRATARSLVNKRRQALARGWPRLVGVLGDSFVELFTKYAVACPLPDCPSSSADGRAFLAWLEKQQPLTDAARIEALAFDLRFVVTPRGLRKRGFAFKLARLRDTPGWLLAIRLPWLGERWWGLPLSA